MSARNIGIAFAKGVQVSEGALTEASAREWIGACISFAAAHNTCNALELADALEAAFTAGQAAGIVIPAQTGSGG